MTKKGSESDGLFPADGSINATDRPTNLVHRKLCFIITSILLVTLFVFILLSGNSQKDSDNFDVVYLKTGDRIQLRSIHQSLYVRTCQRLNSLVLDQTIAWYRGSTFEVEASGECFTLRSLTGAYVSVDSYGVINVDSKERFFATHFAAIATNLEDGTSVPRMPDDGTESAALPATSWSQVGQLGNLTQFARATSAGRVPTHGCARLDALGGTKPVL